MTLLTTASVDGRNPANHLGCIKPSKQSDILHTNWCRISEPSTVGAHFVEAV